MHSMHAQLLVYRFRKNGAAMHLSNNSDRDTMRRSVRWYLDKGLRLPRLEA